MFQWPISIPVDVKVSYCCEKSLKRMSFRWNKQKKRNRTSRSLVNRNDSDIQLCNVVKLTENKISRKSNSNQSLWASWVSDVGRLTSLDPAPLFTCLKGGWMLCWIVDISDQIIEKLFQFVQPSCANSGSSLEWIYRHWVTRNEVCLQNSKHPGNFVWLWTACDEIWRFGCRLSLIGLKLRQNWKLSNSISCKFTAVNQSCTSLTQSSLVIVFYVVVIHILPITHLVSVFLGFHLASLTKLLMKLTCHQLERKP